MKIAVIGGGASGFFSAIHLKEWLPQAEVVILERSSRVLAKVKVSGGGRCNLTNSFAQVGDLSKIYPRGHRLMKRLLKEFGPADTYRWFEQRGVPLVTQEDECVFPQAQDSDAVILCLRRQAQAAGVVVRTGCGVEGITRTADGDLLLQLSAGVPETFQRAILTTGGAPKAEGHEWLSALGHQLEQPCPSLFTFQIADAALTALMGIVVEQAQTALAGTKMRAEGPLLITHWGMSGPAVLKLSSHGARYLAERDYRAQLLVNWTGSVAVNDVAADLLAIAGKSPRKQLGSIRPYGLQQRLWCFLLERSGLAAERTWADLGKKGLNRLVNVLTADTYAISGRGTYKEEFVTCGGVSLESVAPKTLESKVCPGLFFAGEVLDIDAVTGGFNLQAAWTTGYVAAQGLVAGIGR